MKYIILLLTILINPFANAGGQQPMTAIFPMHQIYEGTEVFIGYDPLRYPCLERLVNFQGLWSYTDIDNNNHIDFTISALGNSPCLDLSLPYEQYNKYSLGQLPAGEYTIQMYWVHPGRPLPVPPNIQRAIVGETINFEVLAAQPIPYTSIYTLIMLGVLLCILTLLVLRKQQT